MLKDNLLGDRLNAVKNGKPIPQISENYSNKSLINSNVEQTNKLYYDWISKLKFIDVILASFLYGFAFKTLFGLDWSIIGALSVGFLFNHAITIFPSLLFPKFFKK